MREERNALPAHVHACTKALQLSRGAVDQVAGSNCSNCCCYCWPYPATLAMLTEHDLLGRQTSRRCSSRAPSRAAMWTTFCTTSQIDTLASSAQRSTHLLLARPSRAIRAPRSKRGALPLCQHKSHLAFALPLPSRLRLHTAACNSPNTQLKSRCSAFATCVGLHSTRCNS